MAGFDFANRNYSAKNHGMGSRDMAQALSNGYQITHKGHSSIEAYASHQRHFATYMKDVHQIKDLRKVSRDHVVAYANYNLDKNLEGTKKFGLRTCKNRISAVNEALKVIKTNYTIVEPKKIGFPKSDGIARIDHSISEQKHAEAISSANPYFAAMLNGQRALGLRGKESALIDAKNVLKNAEISGKIRIETGTKGHRPRELEYRPEQHHAALEKLAELQADNRSLIPAEFSWAQWQNKYYAELSKIGLNGGHGERRFFAHELYQNYTQKIIENKYPDQKHVVIESPLRAGVDHKQHHAYIAEKLSISIQEAKSLDKQARTQVASDLGHGRISVTNQYLG